MPQMGRTNPQPILGIVPILGNLVSISIPQFAPGGRPGGSAVGAGSERAKGSIEATGISSFLVSCNELAAGVIAGSLQAGVSPFTVNYALTEQFYLPTCEVDVDIDMDKTYESFSAAVSVSGLFTNSRSRRPGPMRDSGAISYGHEN